jgi:hypothetical protein
MDFPRLRRGQPIFSPVARRRRPFRLTNRHLEPAGTIGYSIAAHNFEAIFLQIAALLAPDRRRAAGRTLQLKGGSS